MADFLLYWRPSTVESTPVDREQWWAGSSQFAEDRVRSGDLIWAVTSFAAEDLCLVARIPVERVVHSRAAAVAIVGEDAWRDASHFAIGTKKSSRPKQDINLSKIARRLAFDTKDAKSRRLPKGFDGKNLQAMRRLTPESSAVLQQAWDTGDVAAPPQFDWTRDEVILALDLYFQHMKLPSSDKHPAVVALSDLLRVLPIHPGRHLDPTFRNPNGVYLKLTNIRSLASPGTGMKSVSRMDREVWDEFRNDQPRLRRLAEAIKAGYQTHWAKEPVEPEVEEEEFQEGRIAYRLHKHRERNRDLVKKKKEQIRSLFGSLSCEACAFDFEVRYGPLGKDFIECHHTIPVSEMAVGARTKLEDVVLVCSNCHRMLHRMERMLPAKEVRGIFAAV